MSGSVREARHDALESGLRRVAVSERLLVGCDFDGTLADIVDHPDAVVPDWEAVAALRSLAQLPKTRVAILSGRSRDVLIRHLGHTGLTLVGSHGAETGEEPARSADEATTAAEEAGRRALDEAAEALARLAGEYDGALTERKPTAVAFHYRRVDESRRDEAAERAAAVADELEALRIQPGHMVVELVAGTTNKGEALDALRRASDATATVFVGDDRTDEHAFARLGPADLAVKVGPGHTCAPVRVATRAEVAPLLQRLHALRSALAPGSGVSTRERLPP